MTNKEKLLFEKLTVDREESARNLEKRSMRGVKTSVVDKYTDQAHFIYELLQNADDVGATSVRFVLDKNGLIFAHNGTRRFTVTDVSNEDEDSDRGALGDINSITSIANSNKSDNRNAIGKFGVGFKAVFQYTETPIIYDPDVAFRIERFIVPKLVEGDYKLRKPDETLFLFPFNHPKKSATVSYDDISSKLLTLSYPILFLSKIKDIDFQFENVIGLYGKSVKETRYFKDITAEYICLTQNNGEDIYDEYLWMFSREDENDNRYSVVFFVDENGVIKPVSKPAFCFFPTKESTSLNFIVHAPFLLNDSREGILAGDEHNKNMVNLLANLAGDSFICLKEIALEKGIQIIGDNILDIVPVDISKFTEVGNRDKLSFKPFFTEIKKRFETEAIIPAKNGYVSGQNAYWPFYTVLTEIFSDEQLAELTGNPEAKWVFASMPRHSLQRIKDVRSNYIDDIVKVCLDENDILSGSYSSHLDEIKASFIEHQSIEWLHKFYAWLSETTSRTNTAEDLPIFLNSNREASYAFDNNNMPILFLPAGKSKTFNTVLPELTEEPETLNFFKKIGITEPSLKDEIYNHILPKYKSGAEIDPDNDFKSIFGYYKQCPQAEISEFIRLLQSCSFIRCNSGDSNIISFAKADAVYYPIQELKEYFASKQSTKFVDTSYYGTITDDFDKDMLEDFFKKLGVSFTVHLIEYTIERYEVSKYSLPIPRSSGTIKWTEKRIDGCSEILDAMEKSASLSLSLLLWNQLLNICAVYGSKYDIYRYINGSALGHILRGNCEYIYYSVKTQPFDSIETRKLRSVRWLVNKNGDFCSPAELLTTELSNEYEVSGACAKMLFEYLGIKEPEIKDENRDILDDDKLSDEQKDDLIMARYLKKHGIESQQDLERAIALLNDEKAREEAERIAAQEAADADDEAKSESIRKVTRDISKKVKDIQKKKREQKTVEQLSSSEAAKPRADAEEETDDSDEYSPTTVNYSKKIEKEKEKSAAEIDKIAYIEQLQNQVLLEESEGRKYSYQWFTTLLELESLYSGEDSMNSREVSISFAKVEREPDTNRTLILKHPSRHIPQFMEDLADIPLVLHSGNEKKTVAIEVINIKSYTLRVKLKANAEIGEIDLSRVTEATINAQNPIFLLEALKKQFNELESSPGEKMTPEFNMKEWLPDNIEFVFGPPGTGKTTHLAKNVILPLMAGKEKPRILVLAPTNKAADVLALRIMEVSPDKDYENWLARFGGTCDEALEQSPVFRDKTFDIQSLEKSCVITTIARFPYDYFMPQGKWLYLREMKWDYIIIDEASMIPIANIVYPLYKKQPQKFVIAGDPFQIEPIAAVEQWKDENIYTMVELNSFVKPEAKPHNYKVETLTTQYRSVPAIGDVFSQLTYGGILKHHRTADCQRKLNIDADFLIETLNIIKFPVSKYESIYRPKRLQGKTPYHVYSALFSCEFADYLAGLISKANPNESFKIGIISTYRAQADLIDKLLGSMMLPKNVDVQVGTIHGFQGDECDIIIAVYNPPPAISSSSRMFLNKRNIINVSISRARDYMIIIMPDDETENVEKLERIKKVEKLFKKSGVCAEYDSHDIENIMFGNPHYLEDNSFSTSHQSVNVYGMPEKFYEIRSEDTAVDVQIHKGVTSSPSTSNRSDAKTEMVSEIKKQNTRLVFNKVHGKGEVVGRVQNENGILIKIKYENESKEISYIEEKAFSSGTLKLITE